MKDFAKLIYSSSYYQNFIKLLFKKIGLNMSDINIEDVFNTKLGEEFGNVFTSTLMHLFEINSGLILYRNKDTSTSIKGGMTQKKILISPYNKDQKILVKPFMKIKCTSRAPSNKKKVISKNKKKS